MHGGIGPINDHLKLVVETTNCRITSSGRTAGNNSPMAESSSRRLRVHVQHVVGCGRPDDHVEIAIEYSDRWLADDVRSLRIEQMPAAPHKRGAANIGVVFVHIKGRPLAPDQHMDLVIEEGRHWVSYRDAAEIRCRR